jgi:rSAM/selenodomain-associated transferase 1
MTAEGGAAIEATTTFHPGCEAWHEERREQAMRKDAQEDRSASCAIAVMAKASIPGRTKTRLVPPLSEGEAADLNTAFLCDAADNLLAAGALANIGGWMAHAPAGAGDFFKSKLPSAIGLIEAVAANFGDCLVHAAQSLLHAGHGSVCLINSDSPTLPVGYLVAAATALAASGDRVVLGPSTDGGYYLIGIKQPHRGLFEQIDWSTEHVFRQTLARADELALPVVVLPTWYDVDEADGLRALVGELFDGQPFRVAGRVPTAASATRRYLSALLEYAGLRDRLRRAQPSSRVA